MSGPRRLALGVLYRWRSEHAAAAKADLDAASAKVQEMKASLSTKDSQRDAFIASEQASKRK
jgi:hypothetical protein